jgi:hypothetical protein
MTYLLQHPNGLISSQCVEARANSSFFRNGCGELEQNMASIGKHLSKNHRHLKNINNDSLLAYSKVPNHTSLMPIMCSHYSPLTGPFAASF